MDTTTLSSPADLSDQDLLARTMQLAREERQVTALLIAHLAEVDARRLYLAEGYSSLFTYCTEVLRLSEHAAYGRIEAARAARRFPLLLEMLGAGWVTLTTVGLLAPHLTAENHGELLDRARHKNKPAVAPGRCSRRLAASISRPATWAAGDGGPAGAAALQGAVHREGGDVCEAAAGARPAAPPDSGRRSGSDSLPGPDGTPGGSGQAEVRRHGPSSRGAADGPRLAAHPGRGEAGRLAAGWGAVRVRGGVRAPLHRDRLPGVPPCEAARGGWRVHNRQHPTALPRA